MTDKLYVSPSPHLRSGETTRRLMLDVIIALIPALVAAVIIFGPRALLIVSVTVLSCVLSEYLARKIMKRDTTIGDLSAVVTGILLAYNLPVGINPLIAAFGGVVAIVVVKQMFGGIGMNFVNPALTARIVLMASFPTQMSTWSEPFYYLKGSADAVTTATPLPSLVKGDEVPSLFHLFMGLRGGCLGEVCAAALLLGGIYLVARRVISPVIPLCFLGTVALFTLLLGQNPLYHLLTGGVLLGAIFMATDYTTSPLTFAGKIVFGIGCGLITTLIRVFGALPEGVSYSIILMNILVPHIERITRPVPFGERRRRHEKD
ncbi:MAG TPA: RnfABCDGE type electron transport complex subunit D [Candidatus Gallacutalibacter stercoravium]|nr:RnfABCDGE type electron transport complex subunit D [Candidatus Gallacutalibacter stercoravium]